MNITINFRTLIEIGNSFNNGVFSICFSNLSLTFLCRISKAFDTTNISTNVTVKLASKVLCVSKNLTAASVSKAISFIILVKLK